MRVIAEHERRAADGERPVVAPCEELAGIDDIDRAEAEALVDVRLLAKGRGREDLDAEAVVRRGDQGVIRRDAQV